MINLRVIITTVLLLLTIGSGVWLSRLGRPLNSILFGIHKVVGLVTVIFIITSTFHFKNDQVLGTSISLIIGLEGFLILSILVSGVMLSFETVASTFLKLFHKVTSGLAVILIVISFYLLTGA